MLTKEKNTPAVVTVEVTARQINEAAIELNSSFPLLSQAYTDMAATVAINGKGKTKINYDSPLAREIRSLNR